MDSVIPSTWQGWVFTLVVAIIFGVVANALYDLLKGKVSEWLETRRQTAREKDEEKQQQFLASVQELIDHPELVALEVGRLTDRRNKGSELVLGGAIFATTGSILMTSTIPRSSFIESLKDPRALLAYLLLAGSYIFVIRLAEVRGDVNKKYDVIKEYRQRILADETSS